MFHQFGRSRQTSRAYAWALRGALTLGVSGCSSDDEWPIEGAPRNTAHVNVVYDPSVDFSRYRSFAFESDEDPDAQRLEGLGPRARRDLQLVNERIALELADLGLVEVSAEEADLIAFSLGRTRSGASVTWSCVGAMWGGYWYWDYYYDPCAWLEPSYAGIDRTTLMVGLLAAASSEVTFAGFIRGIEDAPGGRSRQLVRAVERVFAQYPARPAPAADGSASGGAGTRDAGAGAAEGYGQAGDAGAYDAGLFDAAVVDASVAP